VELSGIEPLTPTLPVLIVAYWKGVFKGGDTKLVPFKGWCRCNCKVGFETEERQIVDPFALLCLAYSSFD